MKVIKKIAAGLVIILLVGIGVGYFYLNQKLPIRDGELKLSGLTDPVEVLFDKWGVPHIYAQNETDLNRAFGYVHAQDRLFQMELLARLAQGRLAEILGPKLVEVDQLFLTLQLHRFTTEWMRQMDRPENQHLIKNMDAYLDGINQYVETRPAPIEFAVLGIPQRKYKREDIASIAGYMSYSFVMAFREDPLVQEIANRLGPDYLKDLGTHWKKGSNMIPVQVENKIMVALADKVRHISDDLIPAGLFHGSNSWIMAPQKTQSGQAMLVNDPHIGFSQPAVWYEAHLNAPGFEIYGHFLALVPTATLGFNHDVAWGITMFENDDMDFYQERVNPDNPNQYWAIDHWEEFEVHTETIKVKGETDIELRLRKSRHGPIVTDAFAGTENNPLANIKNPLAMWWAFYDMENGMLRAFDDLARSKTTAEARKAVSQIYAPGLNIMYANKTGDIGWWAVGKLPIRPKHVNSKMILNGADGKDDIQGYYDFAKNPQNVNPKSGVIYTSNNQPADTGIGLVPGYYAPRDRAQKIEQYLYTDKSDWTPDDMKTMLMDNVSPRVKFLQDTMLPSLKSASSVQQHDIARQALAVFEKWQGNHDPEEVAVTLFYQFKKELCIQIMQDELGESGFKTIQSGFLLDRTLWTLFSNFQSPWWDNIKTDGKTETADEIIISSWIAAIDHLQAKFGADITEWQWKNASSLEHVHTLGNMKPLDKIFNVGPFAVPAGEEIINNLGIRLDKEPYKVSFGPSTRRIIDFGNTDMTFGILPTGQSGNFMDPHYDDQAEMYNRGEFRQQYLNKKDVQANIETRLEFSPKSKE